jgi:PAS domain S-box-containing protein
MTADNLSQRVSELSQRLEELQAKCASNPANAAEILSDALESLRTSIEKINLGILKAEEITRNAESQAKEMEAVFSSIADGVVVYDKLANITYINKAAKKISGLTGNDYARPFAERMKAIVSPTGKPFRYEELPFNRAVKGEVVKDFEMIADHGPGKRFTILASAAPIHDDKGEIVGVVSTMKDIADRKRAEERLLESEQRFRDAIENFPNVFVIYDQDRRVQFVNSKGLQIIGLSEKDVIGRKDEEIFPPDMINSYLPALKRAIETKTLQVLERTRHISMGGQTIIVNILPLLDDNRNIRHIMGITYDITERKRAEEALRESEQRYREIIETAEEGIAIHETDGTITYVNRRMADMLGYSRKEIIGRSSLDFVDDEERKKVIQLRESLKEEGGFTKERKMRRKDGSILWTLSNLSPRLDGAGNFIGYLAMYTDISERKRAEEEIRRSEERFRSIFESTQEAIILIDAEMRCINANPGAGVITGIPHEQLVGQFLQDFVNPGFDLSATWPAFKKTGRFAGEVGIRHKDGTFRTVEATGRADILPGQHLFVGHDITERMRMEDELRRARDKLEERVQERTAELSDANENLEVINEELQVEISEHKKTEKNLIAAKEAAEAAVEAKAAFLANMSHELRTPLNAVIGYSGLLLDDNLTNEQKENIESIKDSGEALLAIISDILEFSRAEKEKVELEQQPLSLKRCIEESMDMVAVQADKKGLNLSYTIGYGIPDTIIGDPGRLRQILVNLLSNAVKFTDKGNISVFVSSIALEGNKCKITFEVRDTGIGMPQDKMNRLFKPFEQLEYVISRKRNGAGLGLSISKKLVELMGGEIWTESEEGKGSTFRFTIQANTIPGKHLDLGEKDRSVYKNLSVEKPLSILVAEDNPSNQKVLVEMLKRLGYRPDAVADGVEVLQALKIRPYDLIFMDIRMPEMDGLTAAKEIRRLIPDSGPRIVAVTAFAMEGDREKCLEAGMDGYIAKPVKLGDLAEVLDKYQPHKNC